MQWHGRYKKLEGVEIWQIKIPRFQFSNEQGVVKAKGVEGEEPIILRQTGFNSSNGSGYSGLCDEFLSHPSEGV